MSGITFGAPMDNGLIVNVLEFVSGYSEPLWRIESIGSDFHLTPSITGPRCLWPDAMLRPIRDQPGEDETLAWAGLPKYREDLQALESVTRETLEDLV